MKNCVLCYKIISVGFQIYRSRVLHRRERSNLILFIWENNSSWTIQHPKMKLVSSFSLNFLFLFFLFFVTEVSENTCMGWNSTLYLYKKQSVAKKKRGGEKDGRVKRVIRWKESLIPKDYIQLIHKIYSINTSAITVDPDKCNVW